ncbi:major facilitator superfamily domain-containing protein [Vararia minispora EC-137]|uniref:Major facilitator superfamily domain-containing protein n=1 Tax=Vararia minispora EC-137 TaxID=1314806 RepID=A0ACB8QA99_9AGAM|nr:major facilitator superfamily domain-containing protein [Vararia minispora EC-137]
MHYADKKAHVLVVTGGATTNTLDIEHQEVHDDPRKWSPLRKSIILFIIACAALIAGFSGDIYNPGISDIERDLHATSSQISLSLAIFTLVQGSVPLFWASISEIKGRKLVYILSVVFALVGSILAAVSHSISELIGTRVLQGVGGAAVTSIGAATLADLYDSHERGTRMGIYYATQLLGPSLGPLIGGILTQTSSWRATFWFLVAWQGMCLFAFVFIFRDTFRRERSLAYQGALRRRRREHCQKTAKWPAFGQRGTSTATTFDAIANIEAEPAIAGMNSKHTAEDIKLSFADINPLPPLWQVLRRPNNFTMLFSNGLSFGFNFCITYTCTRTLEGRYGYDALKTGLVLLAFGMGNCVGGVLGGRWSDYTLRKLKEKSGGKATPEARRGMRLESTKHVLFLFPIPVIAYGWLAERQAPIAAVCIALFFSGFFAIWIYSSTIAYIVDANSGRSSSAVATNSFFRGVSSFAFGELAVPLQVGLGDGGMYTLWAGLLIICEILILLVFYHGGKWRESAEEKERKASLEN